jgi:hypothetical protein
VTALDVADRVERHDGVGGVSEECRTRLRHGGGALSRLRKRESGR